MRERACALACCVLACCASCDDPAATPARPAPDVALAPVEPSQLAQALAELAGQDIPLAAAVPPRDGIWRVRDDDGHLVAEGAMRDGRREGTWQRWRADGQLLEEGDYAADRPIGTWELWGRDGVPLPPVTYDAGACSLEPALPADVSLCGTGPPPPAIDHLGGAGEYRRCVGFAEPWLTSRLVLLSLGAADAIGRANSPELDLVVERVTRAAVARLLPRLPLSERTDDYLRVQYGRGALRAHGAASERLVEMAMEHPELGPVLGGVFRMPSDLTPGRAARLYRARIGGLLSTPDPGLDRGLEIVSAVAVLGQAHPELTLALTEDAMRALASRRYHVGQLREQRAAYRFARGELDEATEELDEAERSYEGSCSGSGCGRAIAPLRAQIARARGDLAGARAIDDAIAAAAAAETARRTEDARLRVVFDSAAQLTATHRERAAVAQLEAEFAAGDAFGPALGGGTPWGAALRWRAGTAYLALGELDDARRLTQEAIDRIPPDRPGAYADTMAEIERAERARAASPGASVSERDEREGGAE